MLYKENLQYNSNAGVKRVPADILYSLHKDMPKPQYLQKFSMIQKQIKTLYDCASQWKNETEHVLQKHTNTKLTEKHRMVNMRESFTQKDFDTLVALSECTFLSKASRS